MMEHSVVITAHAEAQMDRHLSYIVDRLRNPQAAESVYRDFMATARSLSITAESIGASQDAALRERRLKRVNFRSHNYFLLFREDSDTVVITNVYHFRENYIAKLE